MRDSSEQARETKNQRHPALEVETVSVHSKMYARFLPVLEWFVILILVVIVAWCFWGRHRLLLLPPVTCLALYGYFRPREIMTLALVISPFCVGLDGDLRQNVMAVVSASDLLLFLSLPAAAREIWSKPGVWRLNGMGLPALAFLGAALLSFALNVRFMHGASLSYFSGWLRSAQIVLLLPLIFAACTWSSAWLRKILIGYVTSALVLAVCGMLAFAEGMRDGVKIFGMQKNTTGIAIVLAALILATALIRPLHEPELPTLSVRMRLRSRFLLGTALALLLSGVVVTLSRGADISLFFGLGLICMLRRRFLLLAIMVVVGVGAYGGIQRIVPHKTGAYLMDFSTHNIIVGQRLSMMELSRQRFRQHLFLGDGMRTRRDITPHNLEITLLAENGLIGTALFLWVLAAQANVFRQAKRASRHDPVREWFCISIAACALALLVHGQFDPYWRRGPLLLVWAGTGIIISQGRPRRADSDRNQMEMRPLLELEQTT